VPPPIVFEPDEVVPASGAIDAASAATLIARAFVAGHAASVTATPDTDFTFAGGGSASFISMRTPFPSRRIFCGAAGSMRPSRSGKKVTFAGTLAPCGGVNRTTSAVLVSDDSNFQPVASTGRLLRVRSMAASMRGLAGASVAASVSVVSSSPFSGMQMSLHTSHSARAFTGTFPALAFAGGVSSVSSTTSSS
jgi:hypothetical protein